MLRESQEVDDKTKDWKIESEYDCGQEGNVVSVSDSNGDAEQKDGENGMDEQLAFDPRACGHPGVSHARPQDVQGGRLAQLSCMECDYSDWTEEKDRKWEMVMRELHGYDLKRLKGCLVWKIIDYAEETGKMASDQIRWYIRGIQEPGEKHWTLYSVLPGSDTDSNDGGVKWEGQGDRSDQLREKIAEKTDLQKLLSIPDSIYFPQTYPDVQILLSIVDRIYFPQTYSKRLKVVNKMGWKSVGYPMDPR